MSEAIERFERLPSPVAPAAEELWISVNRIVSVEGIDSGLVRESAFRRLNDPSILLPNPR
jgi:hypothetical protein